MLVASCITSLYSAGQRRQAAGVAHGERAASNLPGSEFSVAGGRQLSGVHQICPAPFTGLTQFCLIEVYTLIQTVDDFPHLTVNSMLLFELNRISLREDQDAPNR